MKAGKAGSKAGGSSAAKQELKSAEQVSSSQNATAMFVVSYLQASSGTAEKVLNAGVAAATHVLNHVRKVAKERRVAEKKAARSKGKPSDGGRSPGGDSSTGAALGPKHGGISKGGAGR